jgi:Family of unknown function (DUF6166)
MFIATNISPVYQASNCLTAAAGRKPMKTFCGDRTIDGVKVTVDGKPLDQRLDLHRYTANGFEWSYEGPEPRQLSLAILAAHLDDAVQAKALVEPFMKAVVANFGNDWEMTSADIDAALAELRTAGQLGY